MKPRRALLTMVVITGVMFLAGSVIGCGCKQGPDDTDSTEVILDTGMIAPIDTGAVNLDNDTTRTDENNGENKPDPGQGRRQAPDFTLTDLSNKSHTLSGYRGKVVVMDFWATWCGPCKVEIPHLIELYNKYRSQGMVMLSIGIDERSALARLSPQLGINYPVLVDEDRTAAQKYGVQGIPRTIMIDKKGRIAFDHTGFAPGMEAELEADIQTLIAEQY